MRGAHIASALSVFVCTTVFAAEKATVPLKGHVLAGLGKAQKLPTNPKAIREPIAITIVLDWSDPKAYEAFALAQERLMASGQFRALSQAELTARFGPSEAAYNSVIDFLKKEGFTAVAGSANRLTVTARGTRAQAEHAFRVQLQDYRLEKREFFANDREPSVPRSLAAHIRSISGLSSYPRWHHFNAPAPVPAAIANAYGVNAIVPDRALAGTANGAGEVIGLPEFFTFAPGDVTAWLASAGLPANMISRLHVASVDGGNSVTDPEVVLDIDAVMGFAPGASSYNVFVAPPTDSFAALFNFSVTNLTGSGARVLSFSYGGCESQFTNAELDAGDALIQAAILQGVSFFAASGDSGNNNTCCDAMGNCNQVVGVNFPACAPHAIAVGGTTLRVDGSGSYQSESFWNANGGAGGFGVSSHFARPSYQDGHTSAPRRSVPDVAADADPGSGINICFGGCGQPTGGTSLAAPLWAGAWALVAQASGTLRNVASNQLLYSLPATAFHGAGSMTGAGNDFSHVGLGSPNLPGLVAPCGQLKDQPCCNGTTCSPGLACAQGQCECGGHGQPCCGGATPCGSDLVCANHVCACGSGGQPCCDPNQTCAGGFTCIGSASGNTCHCGDLEEACCNGTTCSSPLLVCSAAKGYQCISACGHKSELCCHSAASPPPPSHDGSGPGWCYGGEGLSCVNDHCVCGGRYQACCQPGATCGAGLACVNLVCAPQQQGQNCSHCTTNLAMCLQGCKTDPAHQTECDCLCQVTACDCRTQNQCVLSCQPPACHP